MKAKKIIAIVLALASMFTVMAIPAFAESDVIEIIPNQDNWINGQNYRLETSTETSYARIKDGKLELNMTMFDLFWIPTLNIKDETTTFTAEDVIVTSGKFSFYMVTGITSPESGDMMLYTGVYTNWVAQSWGWNSGGGVSKIQAEGSSRADAAGDKIAPNYDEDDSNNDGVVFDGFTRTGESLSAKVEIVDLNAANKGKEGYECELSPRVHIYENSKTATVAGTKDIFFTWDPFRPIYGAFGFAHGNSGYRTFTIDTLSATNTVEAETWTETFDNCVVDQKPVTLYQGYQTTAKDADGNVNIRFVATVSATEAQLSSYTSVGFEILPVQIKGYTNTFDYRQNQTNGKDPKPGCGIAYPTRIVHGQEPNIVELTDKNRDKATNTLFTSILEGNNERDVAYFLGDNTDGYIYVVNLTGVPTENNLHFAVRTYYTDAAGNKVYGEIAYIKVDMSSISTDGHIVTAADISALRYETDKRIEAIKKTADLTPSTGVVYYVSSSEGSDGNSGTSTSKPFKTIGRVNEVLKTYGRSNQTAVYVCFKRGDVWRGEQLVACDNLTVTAYGTGAKPIIMGSYENGGGEDNVSKWKNVSGNIWKYEGSQSWDDVGNIVFNDGESYAKKIIQLYVKNSGSSSYNITDYTNGNGQQYVFNSYTDLKNDLDFYHDKDFDGGSGATGYLYLYSAENPALRFESIEFAPHVNLLYIRGAEGNDNIVIDNICFKYSGGHAIAAKGVDTDSVTAFTVQNCEFGWIGGSIQTRIKASVIETEAVVYDVRYGNAIEIYGACDGFTVKNNYIYQVFDAGITVQKTMSSGDGDYSQKNVLWTQNVIENCNYSVEYFLTKIPTGNDSIMSNFQITDNLMWNSGTGLCETRGVWDRGFSAHIKCQFTAPCNRAENFVISGNTMVGIRDSFIQIRNSYGTDSMPLFENNSLYGYYDFEGEAEQGYRIGEVRVTSDGKQIWTPYDTNIEAYLTENMGSKYGKGNKYYFIF